MERVSYGILDAALLQDEVYSRPLAENLPPDAAKKSLNRFMTRQSKVGLFHSAWRHVEFALNREVNLEDSLKETYFDNASELLGRAMHHTTTEDLQLASLTLSTYLSCFLKRARGEALTSDDCQGVYESLGSAITYLEPRNPGDPPLLADDRDSGFGAGSSYQTARLAALSNLATRRSLRYIVRKSR